jgi:hypothetical protein
LLGFRQEGKQIQMEPPINVETMRVHRRTSTSNILSTSTYNDPNVAETSTDRRNVDHLPM